MALQNNRLVLIDSLRGIAAIWVMFFHFYFAIKGTNSKIIIEPFHTLLRIGDQGVFIFFVLSGFVISLAVKTEKLSWNYISRFFARRLVRLDIPYWIVIIFTGLSVVIMSRMGLSSIAPSTLNEFIINFLYLDNLIDAESIVSVGWTLQYEVQFYLFYILLLYIILKLFNNNQLLLFSVFLFTFLISLMYWFAWFPFTIKGLFLNYWFYFLLGVFVQQVTVQRQPSYFFLLPLLLVAIHFTIFSELSTFVACCTALFLFIAGHKQAFNKWLNGKLLVSLGTMSYSLYLIHPFLGNRILRFFSNYNLSSLMTWALFAVTCCISLLAAFIFFKLVERPSLRLSKRIKV